MRIFTVGSREASYWLSVVALGLVVGLSIQFARAWTNPTADPPGGNVAGPLTTGAGDQVKTGGLGLGGNFLVSGLARVMDLFTAAKVQLVDVEVEGTVCPSNGLVARDDIGKLLSCQSKVWHYSFATPAPVSIVSASGALNPASQGTIVASCPVDSKIAGAKEISTCSSCEKTETEMSYTLTCHNITAGHGGAICNYQAIIACA